jgi:hypothetical protein
LDLGLNKDHVGVVNKTELRLSPLIPLKVLVADLLTFHVVRVMKIILQVTALQLTLGILYLLVCLLNFLSDLYLNQKSCVILLLRF